MYTRVIIQIIKKLVEKKYKVIPVGILSIIKETSQQMKKLFTGIWITTETSVIFVLFFFLLTHYKLNLIILLEIENVDIILTLVTIK